MTSILNLTQHKATSTQLAAGVVDMDDDDRMVLSSYLNFVDVPSAEEVRRQAFYITLMAHELDATKVMIGGAPYLMAPLERALKDFNIKAVYAFSERVSSEKTINGEVVKTSAFVHKGFVEV